MAITPDGAERTVSDQSPPPSRPEPRAGRDRLSSIVARFSVINGAVMALGILTGPLQARALGPSGRGELAAITVVGSLLPWIAGFGLDIYAGRQVAQGRPAGELMGSIGLVYVLIGLAIAPLGFPIAASLADGRTAVYHFILLSFLILPISLLGLLSFYILNSLEEWGKTIVYRTVPTVTVAIAVVTLFALGRTTVFLLALVTLAAGAAVNLAGLLWVLRHGKLRFHYSLMKHAVPFGFKSWLALLATLTNGRLDQLLMISLTSSSQLGFYAVAVTTSSFTSILVSALAQPLLSRVGAGEHHMVSRALRIMVLLIALGGIAVAAVTPVLLPLAFGSHFQDAVPMALILLLAALPLAVASVLSTAMTAAGRPGIPAVGEIIAIGITVPGLLLLLPGLGGIGAALVSLVAYSVDAGYHLFFARRVFVTPLRDFLIPRRADYAWLRLRLVGLAAKSPLRRPI